MNTSETQHDRLRLHIALNDEGYRLNSQGLGTVPGIFGVVEKAIGRRAFAVGAVKGLSPAEYQLGLSKLKEYESKARTLHPQYDKTFFEKGRKPHRRQWIEQQLGMR